MLIVMMLFTKVENVDNVEIEEHVHDDDDGSLANACPATN